MSSWRGSPMILRSACNGSCGESDQSLSASTIGRKHRHHHHHHHHHHQHREINHIQHDNVIQSESRSRNTHRKGLESTTIGSLSLQSREAASAVNTAVSTQEFISISGQYSDHQKYLGQTAGHTDISVANRAAQDLEAETRINRSNLLNRVLESSEGTILREEMSRSEPYMRTVRSTAYNNTNGSHLVNHHSRRLIGLEETTDSDWSDAIHTTPVRAASAFYVQSKDASILEKTWTGTDSGVISRLWLNLWQTIYVTISNAILFDTWLLSRSWLQRLRRHWMLLLLAIPLIIGCAWTALEKPDSTDLLQPFIWWDKREERTETPQEPPLHWPSSSNHKAEEQQELEGQHLSQDDMMKQVKEQLKVEFKDMNTRYDMVQRMLEHLQRNVERLQETLLSMKKCCRSDAELAALVNSAVVSSLNKVGESEGGVDGLAAWINNKVAGSKLWQEFHERIIKDAKTAAASVQVATSGTGEKCVGCSDMEVLKKMVHETLLNYDADKTGMADYALESAGGSVISTRCSETYNTRSALIHLFGIPLWYLYNSARTAIQPGTHPGECWAFKGSEGRLVIQLATTIYPTAFSLEHIPRSLSLDGVGDTAPKDFSVWGLQDETDPEGVWLGTYTYDRDGEPLQRFPVSDAKAGPFPIVELRIHSNYGRIEYTCLYRFRVHGVPVHHQKP